MSTVQDLEQQIAQRDSLDERLAIARQYEEAEADALEAERRDATLALVDAQRLLDSAYDEWNPIALNIDRVLEDLKAADQNFQDAWRRAKALDVPDLPVKSLPLNAYPALTLPKASG